MKAVRIEVLAVYAGMLLIGHSAFGQDGEAERLLADGDKLAWFKNWQAAEPFFEKAETLFRERGDKRNELYARISRMRGQLPSRGLFETSTYLASVLDDPLTKDDARLRLRCLIVKGDVDLDFDTALAARDWTEALSIAKGLEDPAWVNRANGELGVIGFVQGDYRSGTVKVMGALSQAKKLNDVGAQIRYLTLIGDGLIQLQRNEQAIAMFDQALAVAQTIPELGQPVMPYAGKAEALAALGRTAEAKKLLEDVLEISHKRAALGYESEALLELAKLEERTGQDTEAISHFRQAVAAATKVDGHNLISEADLELSEVLAKEKRYGEAELAAKESLAASRAIGDRLLVPRSLAQLAAVEESKGKYQVSDRLFNEAADIVEAVLATTTTANAKSAVAGSMDTIFLGHFELAAMHMKSPDKAFMIIEGVRGRSIADSLRFTKVNRGPEPAALTSTEKEISKLQLQLLKAGTRDRKRLLTDLLSLEQRTIEIEAGQDPPWLRRAVQPMSLTRLQKALKGDEAFLEYVLTDPVSYCLAISREHVEVFPLAGRSQIGKQVDAVLAALRKGGTEAGAEAALYATVVGPMASVVSSKSRLTIVPDGPLYQLPFEMLGPRPDQRLLASHVVTYAPSGTVFTLLSEKKGSRPSLPLLAVATGTDALAGARTRMANQQQPGTIDREVFDASQPQLRPLPAANGEARTVAGILGGNSVMLLAEAATESALKRQPLGQFRVLHFAVHGLVSTKFPDRSALLLYADPASNEDGFWQAREIARTELNAELVTLSACDVGSGLVVGEEGISNLVRPFLIAGARTVVANLWESDDDFSRGLMREFYSRLAAGMDKGRALQQAKLEMIRKYGQDASSPRLWAGFIMVGESRRSLLAD
jgi:CHAT domain-containing protein/tetratricopeptide (TPR) repeat protein